MVLTLEQALDLIPSKRADVVSAFENFSRSLGRCSDAEYETQKARIQELLFEIDNGEAHKYFHHVYNGLITVGSFYHNEVRLPEPPHIELIEKEENLAMECRC